MAKAAEVRQDHAVEAWPGEVRIGGVDYPASIQRTEIKHEKVDGGWLSYQDFTARVRKTLLVAPPEAETDVIDLADDMTFQLKAVAGDRASSPVWVLRCQRIV